jgi:hypothetical protein
MPSLALSSARRNNFGRHSHSTKETIAGSRREVHEEDFRGSAGSSESGITMERHRCKCPAMVRTIECVPFDSSDSPRPFANCTCGAQFLTQGIRLLA